MLKIFSDVTNKFYENEEAAKKDEERLSKAKIEHEELKKKLADEVEKAKKNLKDIRQEYEDILGKAEREYAEAVSNYCREFGEYRYQIGIDNDLNWIWDFFNDWIIK